MPFIPWTVEPKFVSHKPLGDSVYNELEAVTNNTLVALIQQLACVLKYANFIFEDVTQDLQDVYDRSLNLSSRVENVRNKVVSLDAKSVPIPCGDLTKFSLLKEHYATTHPVETALFEPSKRSLSVRMLYDGSLASPVHLMREIDQYREDGDRTSKYFICMPIIGDKQKRPVDMDIETRRPATFGTARNWQSDEELGIPDLCKDKANDKEAECAHEKRKNVTNELRRLPSPSERVHAMSLKYPYSDVPIDVTGTGFRRMASFRRSLVQQVEYFTRKKKKKKTKSDRRNTIAGGPEIEAALDKQVKKAQQSSNNGQARKRFSMAEGFEHLYSSLRLPGLSKGVQAGDEAVAQTTSATNKRSSIYERLKLKKTNGSSSISSQSSSVEKIAEQDESANEKKTKTKSKIPISTMSQTMSVAVKMRENGSRNNGKNEDSGQSSSGNWSASSSTRASVESENLNETVETTDIVRVSSQTSLSKDSALSEGTTPNDDIRSDSNMGYHS